MYDILIIGGGPAGISAAIYSASRGKRTLVLEQDQVGGTLSKVSTVTHYAAVIPGETGQTFSQRLKEQALQAGVEIRYERVESTSLSGSVKKVKTNQGEYESSKIILAAGSTPNHLDIPGAAQLTGHGMAMNAALHGKEYAGKHVYVVGGADGAIKEALYLATLAQHVTVIHFEDKLGAIAEFLQKVEQTPNLSLRLHSRLTRLEGETQVQRLELTDEHTGAQEWISDPGCGIFVYAGSTPNTHLFPELDLEQGYIPVNQQMETSIPGVYAVGDIRVKQVRQAATAISDGAIAAVHAATH